MSFNLPQRIIPAVLLLSALHGMAQSATAQTPVPAARPAATFAAPIAAPVALNANFNGRWVGVLEYRDFQSNQQVFLPTWLSLIPLADGRGVTLSYIYDDGPTKTVRESSTLTFTIESNRATLTSNRDQTSESYDVAGLAEFSKQGRGVLTLTGPGTENKKPVDVRITLTLRRNLYTFRKETRQQGEEFKFRDAYTFTPAEPPAL